MAVAVIVYGPKAAGKSQVAEALFERYGVLPVDTDQIVLDLLARGRRPDPRSGWLAPIEQAVTSGVRANAAVSVEATGAWESDWQLADDLRASGIRVLTVWVCAPMNVTLDRLTRRASRKVPTTMQKARAIYAAACAHARQHTFDLTLDTGVLQRHDLAEALAPLACGLSQ